MKTKKRIRKSLLVKVIRNVSRNPRQYLMAAGVMAIILVSIITIKSFYGEKEVPVPEEESTETLVKKKQEVKPAIPNGYKGIISAVMVAEASSSPYHALGTNLEAVLVGQRTKKRENPCLDSVGEEVAELVNNIDEQSWKLVERTKMSDGDYETLLMIVEAESGGEDIKGRILVANVILNRVASDIFPDNVTDVVWQESGGSPQFTPTVDGRIHTVEVSDITREAVNRAIDGEDYSQGALFFMEKRYSEDKNVNWFDSSLQFLFQHGVHSFYKY